LRSTARDGVIDVDGADLTAVHPASGVADGRITKGSQITKQIDCSVYRGLTHILFIWGRYGLKELVENEFLQFLANRIEFVLHALIADAFERAFNFDHFLVDQIGDDVLHLRLEEEKIGAELFVKKMIDLLPVRGYVNVEGALHADEGQVIHDAGGDEAIERIEDELGSFLGEDGAEMARLSP